MSDDFRGRFKQAWKTYVQARLEAEPGLMPEDIKDKDVAKRIEAWLVGETFTAQTFSKIKAGKQKPSGSQLAAIALELKADYFALAAVRTEPLVEKPTRPKSKRDYRQIARKRAEAKKEGEE